MQELKYLIKTANKNRNDNLALKQIVGYLPKQEKPTKETEKNEKIASSSSPSNSSKHNQQVKEKKLSQCNILNLKLIEKKLLL